MKIQSTILLLCLLGFIPWTAKAQKIGLGVQFLGPTIISSGYLDIAVNQRIRCEFGVGLIGAYGGVKAYSLPLNNKQSFRIYGGLQYSYFYLINFSGFSNVDFAHGLHVPIGVQWRKSSGFSFAAEIGPLVALNTSYIKPVPSLRLAYYFKSN